MKNLIIGLAVGILIGIGIGYLIWGRTSQNLVEDVRGEKLSEDEKRELFYYLAKTFAVKLEFSKVSSRGSQDTDFIGRPKALAFVTEFANRFSSTTPVLWNPDQNSWRVNADKLRELLNQRVVGSSNPLIESVLFEMGVNPDVTQNPKGEVTLVICGLEKDQSGDRYRVMGNTDLGRWGSGSGLGRVHSDPSKDYILEFVDPCIPPPCPKNTFK